MPELILGLRAERPFTGVSGPSRPGIPKQSQKACFGGLQKSPRKYPKKSKNTRKSPILGIFRLFRVFSGTFLQTPKNCEPSDELQESLGPSGPEMPQPPAPGSQNVWKKSRKSPKSLEKVSKMSVRDFFETFSRPLGTPGPEAPGDFFQTFWGFRARSARETPVARRRVRNPKTLFLRLFWEWSLGSQF